MSPEHNSLQAAFRQPFGALTVGQSCCLRLFLPQAGPDTQAEVLLWTDQGPFAAEPMEPCCQEPDRWFFVHVSFSACGLYFYQFQVTQGGETQLLQSPGEPWQLTVCPEELTTNTAWAGKVAYQIFPDRFCRIGTCDLQGKLTPYCLHEDFTAPEGAAGIEQLGNADFYGGNFAGIREKLPVLQELGIQVLYLNPICMAQSSHRYDTADYLCPDPMLGTQEDFSLLCQAAHQLGMRLLLDGVFSHTGSISRYFDRDGHFGGGAASDPESPFRSWYTFQQWPDSYTTWWGISTLPCLNELEPSLLEFLVTGEASVVRHWLRLGADGFRLDVADELPDEFLRALHRVVHEEKPDGIVIGEVWEDASNKISYGCRRTYFTALELDGVMNYPWRNCIIDLLLHHCTASEGAQSFLTLASHYPAAALNQCLVSLSTHDIPRIRTVFQSNAPSLELAACMGRTAAVLQFFLPGMPCIYYGDEAGLSGGTDPDNRRPYPWGQEDRNLFAFYQELAHLRQEKQALQVGTFQAGACGETLLWMQRQTREQTLTLLVNLGPEPLRLPRLGQVLFRHPAVPEEQTLLLRPYGAAILEENSSQA